MNPDCVGSGRDEIAQNPFRRNLSHDSNVIAFALDDLTSPLVQYRELFADRVLDEGTGAQYLPLWTPISRPCVHTRSPITLEFPGAPIARTRGYAYALKPGYVETYPNP